MTDLTIHLIETVKDYCFCRQFLLSWKNKTARLSGFNRFLFV